jgi:hypothetical protein
MVSNKFKEKITKQIDDLACVTVHITRRPWLPPCPDMTFLSQNHRVCASSSYLKLANE